MLEVVAVEDVEVLREDSEEKAVHIFEEYAEGGFELISVWLSEKPEDENGDEAILTALAKHGYLRQARDVDAAGADISFC